MQSRKGSSDRAVLDNGQESMARTFQARSDERQQGRTEPGKVNTALVIQGGSLRSVASCGAAAALNYLGLTNAFDKVYASSSGAVNGAYFLTQQSALGVTVYLEDVNNRKFLNLWRFRKMIDLEFFIDEIVKQRRKHDYDALLSHPTELKILAANMDTSQKTWFSSKDTSIDLYQALKASCALPVIYGRGVPVGQHSYVDGYIVEPIPVLTPLEGDFTDILVLLNRNISVRQPPKPSLMTRLLFQPLMRRELSSELYAQHQKYAVQYNFALDAIENGHHTRPDGHKIRLAYICPESAAEAHRFELDAGRLRAAAYSSWKATFRFFGVEHGADEDTFSAELSRAKELYREKELDAIT